MRKFLTTTAIFLLTATSAFAATTVQGTYSLSYSATQGNGPSFLTNSPNLPTSFTEHLTAGTPTSDIQFFGVSPDPCYSGSGRHCNTSGTSKGTITVTFTFAGVTGTFSDTAAYIADYNGQTDSVDWNSPNPIVVDFADGSELDVTLINAEDWTIYPDIKFLLKGPTPVPEPASIALVGAGLLGLGFVVTRNRRKLVKKAA